MLGLTSSEAAAPEAAKASERTSKFIAYHANDWPQKALSESYAFRSSRIPV